MFYILFYIITFYCDGQYNILFRAQQQLGKKKQTKKQSELIRLELGGKKHFYLQLWWYTQMCTKQEEME